MSGLKSGSFFGELLARQAVAVLEWADAAFLAGANGTRPLLEFVRRSAT